MNINVKSRNCDVTPAIRQYLEKRLLKFEKLVDAAEAQVTLTTIKETQKVEVTIPLNGMILRGEEENYDIYSAIDNVVEKLERQFRRYKTRLAKKSKGVSKEAQFAVIASQPVAEAEEDEEFPVKIKHFPIKPMPVEEAIMQMNLLGHNFFLFLNSDDNHTNLIYRRNDGKYGLLAPEE